MPSLSQRLGRILPTSALLLVASAAPALATTDTVVSGNQIVQGNQCVGVLCADGESLPLAMEAKTGDTPALRLLQTGDSGYTPQTWDIAGNEANFFVRDLTNGSKLPFRIRPGAPTSSVDIGADGAVSTVSLTVQSNFDNNPQLGAVDGAAVLDALRALPITRYSVASDPGAAPHVAPSSAAFHTAFGIGGLNTTLAPQDVAGVALAAVQALDARVSTLSLPAAGPKGDAGAAGADGAAGTKGDTGAAGAPGAPASAVALTAATKRIATLERSNAKLARTLAALQKQVRKLAPPAKHRATARAHASGR
ncbi:MAG TPA: hypothetical protein VGM33_21140 [Baekduia sp.]|jgi:hypothetical protein